MKYCRLCGRQVTHGRRIGWHKEQPMVVCRASDKLTWHFATKDPDAVINKSVAEIDVRALAARLIETKRIERRTKFHGNE